MLTDTEITMVCRVCGKQEKKNAVPAAANVFRTTMDALCPRCKRKGFALPLPEAKEQLLALSEYIVRLSDYLANEERPLKEEA